MNRRSFIKYSTIPLAASHPLVFANSTVKKDPNFKGRIFKALKGGKKRGESIEDFFNRLKGMGYDGVESGNANQAEEYRAAAKKTGIRVHGLVVGGHWSVG